MMWSGGVTFACLLATVGFSEHVSAARPWQQRREFHDPYLFLPPETGEQERHIPQALGEKQFTLRHIYHHGTHKYPDLHRYLDVAPGTELQVAGDDGQTYEAAPEELRAKVASLAIQRLVHRKRSDIDELLNYARIHGEAASLPSSAWTIEEVAGPNVTDKETVLAFAKMASNAYEPAVGEGGWMDVKGRNQSAKFGWESDGLRGHIFADQNNSTIVVALKGTTVALFDGAGTTTKDKENDNLFGSCCCAQGGPYMWTQVCDCMTSTYTCNTTCVVKELHKKDRYYNSARELYHNVTERYPGADVWFTGHSLGGVVSALLGLTYNRPTVTYEAYPDALAASRLGLPIPPGYQAGSHQSRVNTGIYHVGHTADPIYMGACNGGTSWCTIGGYAFEGVCHTGQTCIYDTQGDWGWRVSAPTHRIHSVIKDVIMKYESGPTCDEDVVCRDCYNWKFYESNGTETTTSSTRSSTSTRTRTRTETCKTPGWWGCLDESTTTTATTTTSTSSTSSTSTSTCKTPGWFGCKDPTTTTSSSALLITSTSTGAPTTTATSTTTSTCKTPGWFGCKDPTTATSATPKPSATSAIPTASRTPSPSSVSSSCTSAEWFGLICVDPSPTSVSSAHPLPTHQPMRQPRKCRARNWYGACKVWESVSMQHKSDL